MAVNGYAAAEDVAALKANTAALAVAMGERVGSTEQALSAVQADLSAIPGALETLENSVTAELANKQPADTDLSALAALASAADKLPYATGPGTWAMADLSSTARDLISKTSLSAFRYAAGIQENNTYSLLNVLTDAERLDVILGTNAIDITDKLGALISYLAANAPGSILDASRVTGTWVWTSDPLNPGGELGAANITLKLGAVTIRKNFNSGSIVIPSFFTLDIRSRTKFGPTIKIDAIPGDSNPSVGMFSTHTVGSNGLSGTSGSPVVTLDYSYDGRVNAGALLAIFGVEPYSNNTVAISGAISSGATTIALSTDITDEMAGLIYIKIDDEIIKGSATGTSMTVTQRGANGTTAASHADGATVVQMITRIYRVVSKSGTAVTLDANLDRSLTGASWRCGSVGSRIIGGGLIDGELNRSDPAANNWHCLASTLSADFHVSGGLRLAGGDHGGINLTGCRNYDISLDRIYKCGMPGSLLGSSIWLFGDVADGHLYVRNVDDGSLALAIDNKSFGSIEYGLLKSSERNHVEIGSITNHLASYNLSATHRNTVHIGLNMAPGGVLDGGDSQLITGIPCIGNSVIVGAQPNHAGLQIANPADNFVSINGKSWREVKVQAVAGSILYVPYNLNLSVTTSTSGFKAGDDVDVRTAVENPALTFIKADCYTDGVTTLLFQSQSDGTKEIPIGTVFNMTARGPW